MISKDGLLPFSRNLHPSISKMISPPLTRPFLHLHRSSPPAPRFSCAQIRNHFRRPYTSVLIIPTGVGAAIGGFAGDALPVARTLSSVVDCLISHPNVLNAAMLYWPMPNALYVEGYALDRFAEGAWALQPVHQNKIGLVLDAGIEDELRVRHLQVADAARASLGLPIMEYIITDAPLEVEEWIDPKCGQSTGRIKNPDSLLRAVNTMVKQSQVNAVAVVGRFPDDGIEDMEDYRQGKGVDLLAGVEAVISHLVVKEFRIPCAHAPALSPLPLISSLSPRSAAEEPLIIVVEENETVLDDTPDKLGIEAMKVSNYWEAIGVIAAHKAGLNPNSLRREGINTIPRSPIQTSTGCKSSIKGIGYLVKKT